MNAYLTGGLFVGAFVDQGGCSCHVIDLISVQHKFYIL